MIWKNKDNWIIEHKEVVGLFELICIFSVIAMVLDVFIKPDSSGILTSSVGIVLGIAIIIYFIKREKKNENYCPKRVYYHRLDNGLDEYHYTYFFWEKNKKEGCIQALKENGVHSIYNRRLTLLRRVVFGTRM